MKNKFFKYLLVTYTSLLGLIVPFSIVMSEWKHCVNGFYVNLFDPVFLILGIIAVLFLVKHRWCEAVGPDFWGIPGFVISSLIMVSWKFLHDPVLYYIGAVLYPVFTIWMIFGWRFFYRLFPAFLLMLLGLPTTLCLRFFPDISLNWKISIACVLCIYLFFALLTDFNPIRRRGALFVFFVMIYALLYAAIPGAVPLIGSPVLPFNKMCLVKRIVNPTDVLPAAMEVSLRGDNLLSAKQRFYRILGKNVAVLELKCFSKMTGAYTLYAWFVSERFSTGDYRSFRRLFDQNTCWYYCQFFVPENFCSLEKAYQQ